MRNMNCEDFEGACADLSQGLLERSRQEALDYHRQDCPYCRNFGAETLRVRTAMIALPKLDVSPRFVPNLRRAIQRLEHPEVRPEWGWAPKPYPLAVSAGFAAALLLGFLLLRPANQPANMLTPQHPALAATGTAAVNAPSSQVLHQRQLTPVAGKEQYTSRATGLDTVKHRLPEAPGKEQIPIPVEDDLWRLNQVSTTPASP